MGIHPFNLSEGLHSKRQKYLPVAAAEQPRKHCFTVRGECLLARSQNSSRE